MFIILVFTYHYSLIIVVFIIRFNHLFNMSFTKSLILTWFNVVQFVTYVLVHPSKSRLYSRVCKHEVSKVYPNSQLSTLSILILMENRVKNHLPCPAAVHAKTPLVSLSCGRWVPYGVMAVTC
jgi:hypothetical protein